MAPSRKSHNTHTGIGKAIENSHKKRANFIPEPRAEKATGVAQKFAARSVLEQSSLDDFMAQAALSKATFEAERGVRFVEEGARVVQVIEQAEPGSAAAAAASEAAVRAAARIVVPIPWRPVWQPGQSAEDLVEAEGTAFLDWRRALASLEESEGVVMTPYERNLDFWRQLWRCVERSDLLVQIVDGRDPAFYRSRDLERYVARFPGKRMLLLMNKSDFLPAELRQKWAAYFAARGVDVIFFSALRELHRQQRVSGGQAHGLMSRSEMAQFQAKEAGEDDEDEEAAVDASGTAADDAEQKLPPHGSLESGEEEADVADCAKLLEELRARLPEKEASAGEGAARGTVGFVGYPNVGKSSVINALWGAKKVSMSRTPGKTKHLQTLDLPGTDITLCDCPGLVFPSVVATKGHLAINGTVPITELKDHTQPVRIIVDKMGAAKVAEKYGLSAEAIRDGASRLGDAADPARHILAGYATGRQHFLRVGVPDETWAARRVLRDFCSGALLHCEAPVEDDAPPAAAAAKAAAIPPAAAAVRAAQAEAAGPVLVAAAPTSQQQPAAVSPEADGDGSDFSDLDDFLNGGATQQKGKRGGEAKKKAKGRK